MLVALVFIQVLYVCLIYGPIAAYLVEAFPGKDSLHVALSALPHWQWRLWRTVAADWTLHVCAATGNIYAGLYYPMIVAGVTFVVGSIFLRETHGTKFGTRYHRPQSVQPIRACGGNQCCSKVRRIPVDLFHSRANFRIRFLGIESLKHPHFRLALTRFWRRGMLGRISTTILPMRDVCFRTVLLMLICGMWAYAAQPVRPAASDFLVPFPAHHVIGNIYFVGSKGLGYLSCYDTARTYPY